MVLRRVGVVVLVLAGPVGGAWGEVVFENLVDDAGHVLVASSEVGDEIALGGTARQLTLAELAVYSFGGGDFDVRFWIYANDGPGGEPGTVLYDTGEFAYSHPGGTDLLEIALPWVEVPETVTWMFLNAARESGIGLRAYDPPTVGSSENFYWVHYVNGDWSRQGPASYGGNFGARFTAVPGPGLVGALGVGFGVVVGRRRRG